MRLNRTEYVAWEPEGSQAGADWMAVSEVNIIAVTPPYAVYEFAIWQGGIHKWCKNICVLTDGDTDRLTSTIISRVSSARGEADSLTEDN